VWKDTFIRRLGPGPKTRLLDVAGGTGDIAFRFLDAAGRPAATSVSPESGEAAAVTVCDINKSMLRVGESRAQKLGNKQMWWDGEGVEKNFIFEAHDIPTLERSLRYDIYPVSS
jgi:ubiquinone/menaquinone biosynthesis C-methylase UbiE